MAEDVWVVLLMLALASVAGVLFVRHRHATQTGHPRIMLADMRATVASGDALILDAREPRAFAAGHIPTALSLSIDAWPERSSELKTTLRRHRGDLIVVYCDNEWCGQAEELQQVLVDLGHRRVGLFSGGLEAWRDAGLPVETNR